MKFLIALACLLAAAAAKPGLISPFATPYAAYAPFHYAYSPLHANGYSYTSYSAAAPAPAPVPLAYAYAVAPAPLAYAATPIASIVAAAAAVEKTQYHAQDALGQASYGHTEAFQQHHASQDAAGNKVGSYSYVAPDGQVIATNYVADALGFRVASNATPVAPVDVPVPVKDTAEVVAARAAHLAAHAEAKSRSRRAAQYLAPFAAATTLTTPLAYSAAYAAPTPAAAAYSPYYAYGAFPYGSNYYF